MIERKKLLILEVEAPKPVGKKGTIKYSFKAKEGETPYSYFTFSQSLAELVKAGETIEADIETTSREYEGNTYIDRKLTQIYKDGQPISPSKSGGGGWTPRQSSPEERASIEAQVAYKGAIELWVAGKVDTASPLAKAALTWALSRLQSQGQKVIDELWPEEGKEAQPVPASPAVSQPSPKIAPKTEEKRVFANAGRLAFEVQQDGGNLKNLMKTLGLESISELDTPEKLQAAWQTHKNLKEKRDEVSRGKEGLK